MIYIIIIFIIILFNSIYYNRRQKITHSFYFAIRFGDTFTMLTSHINEILSQI